MRSNTDWINALTGKQGSQSQQIALNDLGLHLHSAAYHQLCKVSSTKAALGNLTQEEINNIAADFAQDAIVKITRNNFALLKKYKQTGSFEGWTAKITARIISSELRRPYWSRRKIISPAQEKQQQDNAPSPENAALVDEIYQAMNDCIRQLPDRRRSIFIRSTIEGEAAEDLAEEFETSANAIHILNYRSREKLRHCLEKKGYGKDTLNIFKT